MKFQRALKVVIFITMTALACSGGQDVTTDQEPVAETEEPVVETEEPIMGNGQEANRNGGQSSAGAEASETGWERRQAQGFSFSYPTDWQFLITEHYPPPGQSFRLVLPPELKASDFEQGTNIIILLLPDPVDNIDNLRDAAVAEVKDNPRFTAVDQFDLAEDIQVAGREAISLRYSVATTDGDQVEGLQVITTLPNGQPLALTLTVFSYDGVDFASLKPVFDRIVESIELTQ